MFMAASFFLLDHSHYEIMRIQRWENGAKGKTVKIKNGSNIFAKQAVVVRVAAALCKCVAFIREMSWEWMLLSKMEGR